MRTLTLAILLAVAPAWACVSSTASQGASVGSDRYRITREELIKLPSGSALDAVERLHRDWLQSRSVTGRSDIGRTYPEVFVDGRPFGPVDSLQQLGTETIEEIRFISPADATTRFGTGYSAGIIEVLMIRSLPG